jgi:hypothetical protein
MNTPLSLFDRTISRPRPRWAILSLGVLLDSFPFREPVFWLIYLLLGAVPVLIFFLNMRPTHLVLASEKQRQLEAVQSQIRRAGQDLMQRLEQNHHAGMTSAEVGALIAYEGRLKETRTWPYRTIPALFARCSSRY